MPDRRFALLALAALAGAACTSPPALAEGRLVDLQVVDRARGDVLETYRARGASWIAGRPGDRYAIRLTNRSGARVLVVLSVDGVNAVSGETASTSQTGYVLAPWQSTEIVGWRKGWQEAAAFYFTALPDSYAARTDRPDHVGVIGAAVFRERVAAPVAQPFDVQPSPRAAESSRGEARDDAARGAGPAFGDARARSAAPAATDRAEPAPATPPAGESPRRESQGELRANSAPEAAAARPFERERKLGTGHGEREYAPTTATRFERATSSPAEVVQLRYDSWVNLRAAGIVPPGNRVLPQPFPGFVPDPRG